MIDTTVFYKLGERGETVGTRCDWVKLDEPLYVKYHDEEWGKPVYDDTKLFEMLILEGAQAGLSWLTILKRREGYRKAFDQFQVEKVASYDEEKIEQLMKDEGIIRNRRKIESAINNAKQFIKIQEQYGTFSNYIWSFVDGKPIINHWKTATEMPTKTDLSDKISKDLKKRGFSFVGSVIIYSYLQAIGIVDDHIEDCICRKNAK